MASEFSDAEFSNAEKISVGQRIEALFKARIIAVFRAIRGALNLIENGFRNFSRQQRRHGVAQLARSLCEGAYKIKAVGKALYPRGLSYSQSSNVNRMPPSP